MTPTKEEEAALEAMAVPLKVRRTNFREALRGLESQGEDRVWRTAEAAGLQMDAMLDALQVAAAALRDIYVRTGDPACTPAYDKAMEIIIRMEVRP